MLADLQWPSLLHRWCQLRSTLLTHYQCLKFSTVFKYHLPHLSCRHYHLHFETIFLEQITTQKFRIGTIVDQEKALKQDGEVSAQ